MASNNKSLITLSGFAELERALLALPKELADNVEKVAVRWGMVPLRKAVKARTKAIKDTGLLSDSIGLSVKRVRKKGQNTNRYTARVGPSSGFRKMIHRKGRGLEFADPRNYAHLVEYGTSKMPAKPFLRNSIAASEDAILAGLVKGYNKGLPRAVAKLKRKKK
jgi:HK97 gp10 family phage protein